VTIKFIKSNLNYKMIPNIEASAAFKKLIYLRFGWKFVQNQRGGGHLGTLSL
jgi:hypothetical protein